MPGHITSAGEARRVWSRYEQAVADYDKSIALDASCKLAYANKAYALKGA
jgi:hypothetical protein